MADGTILVQTSPGADSYDHISDVLKNLNSKWSVVSRKSQAPRTQLWSLDAEVAGAEGEISTETEISLGLPWGGFLKLDNTMGRSFRNPSR